jgi:hypothetical protein
MRFAGQQFVAGQAQLRVWDAAGANPILLSNFPGPNPAGGACLSILLATPSMAARTSPTLTGAYTMAQIPSSYLVAGSLTFESLGGGATWWRVSWGGATYTGAHTVISTAGGGNDNDGTAAPAFASPLPQNVKSVKFVPACATASTTNLADYAESAGQAVLKNNAGALFTVGLPIPVLPTVARFALPGALLLGLCAFGIARRRTV